MRRPKDAPASLTTPEHLGPCQNWLDVKGQSFAITQLVRSLQTPGACGNSNTEHLSVWTGCRTTDDA